ncbi:MAG: tandem-95 repeat protein, partial [Planctomycetaceae bacterium]|nr:tandem-95 repeat protein [Planctomycetaceae bacterium]
NSSLAAVQRLAEGEALTESFDYLLSDGEGGTDTARLIVTIQGANDPPSAVDDSNATDSDTSVVGRVLPNDSDPNPGDTLTVVAVNGAAGDVGQTITLPSGALLRLNADGTYSYDPNGAFDYLAPNQTDVDKFTYTVTDPHGGVATATVTITIVGLNDPPTAWGELMHTAMDVPITAHVLDNDTDPNGEPLSVILIDGPEEGTAVVNADGTITFTPSHGFTGMVEIRYLAEDPHGASSPATLMIMVDPPTPVDPPGPVPAFGYDSFNNFSRPRQILADDAFGTYRQPLLTREIFTLAPEPTFSGFARPGTTVVGRIYNEQGVLIGEGFAHADPGGNWMLQFQGLAKFEHYRIEFDYVVESQDIYGYLGLDPSDNSYQAMQPLTDWMEPLSVAGAIRQSPWHSLNALHQNLQRPLGFGE